MKKLIHAVALTLTIASFSSAAYGTPTMKNSRFPDIVGAVQFPQNNPLLSLSGRAIARSLMRQSIQAILLEENGSCICY
ncbi:hypothetical protein [Nostoc sp.]|uniref:hypothetical protein n=1 Tax=Nostoc sp. TaxID=1180 RepID=UPI002FFBADD8